jgi:hypothetical protein
MNQVHIKYGLKNAFPVSDLLATHLEDLAGSLSFCGWMFNGRQARPSVLALLWEGAQ